MKLLSLHKTPIAILIVAALATFFAYSTVGMAKPLEAIQWLDVFAEGGTSLMAAVWLLMTLSSRPRGKVTYLLALGMGLIMLGAWADCLDEFYKIGKEQLWDHWLEALFTLGGMVVLTVGLYFWRHEQFFLNEHLQKRERLFRDHRAFDRVTQLVNANYLRRLIRMEQSRNASAENCLALLDINAFHVFNREQGVEEGDRALQAVAHMLLLNLSNQDVLCRYAGDRFAIFMPAISISDAQTKVRHLCAMVENMHFYPRTKSAAVMAQTMQAESHADAVAVQLTLRAICAPANESLEELLVRLDRLDRGESKSKSLDTEHSTAFA